MAETVKTVQPSTQGGTYQPVQKKKKGGFFKKLLFTLLILVLVLAAVGGVLFYFAVQDENAGKYSAEPSTALLTDCVVAAVTGTETEITQEELNGFMAYLLEKNGDQGNSGATVNGFYFDLREIPGSAKIYVPVTYHGIALGLNGKVDLSLDDENHLLAITFSDTKIGKLPVSSKLVVQELAKDLPEQTGVKDCTLFVDSVLKFTVDGQETQLNIDQLTMENGAITVKTSGVAKAIEEFVRGKLG